MTSPRRDRPAMLLRTWETFWFREIPPDAYALLRIAFGALGLISLFGATPVSMFWPVDGLAPVPGGGLGIRPLLENAGIGTAAGWAFFVGLLASFTCMTVGYGGGFVVALCFVGTVLQVHWNHLPLSSAHQVMVVVLFCLVWADCNATLSVDAWLAGRRAAGRVAPAGASWQPIWPLQLLRVQVALIYLNSGLWKLFGAPWRDGSAIYFALNQNIFHRFPYGVPTGLEPLATVATYGTVFWEIGFVFLLFHRWTRRLALIMGVLIHVGVWATLEVGPFSWLMIATYIAMLDPEAVSRVARRLQRSPVPDVRPIVTDPLSVVE